MKQIEKETRHRLYVFIKKKKKKRKQKNENKKKKNQAPTSRSFDFVNHSYDYRPKCATLDSIIIINRE